MCQGGDFWGLPEGVELNFSFMSDRLCIFGTCGLVCFFLALLQETFGLFLRWDRRGLQVTGFE